MITTVTSCAYARSVTSIGNAPASVDKLVHQQATHHNFDSNGDYSFQYLVSSEYVSSREAVSSLYKEVRTPVDPKRKEKYLLLNRFCKPVGIVIIAFASLLQASIS